MNQACAYAKSLSVAGLGHTSDQFRCVLVLVAVGRDRRTWIPGSHQSCNSSQDWLSSSLMGAVHLGFKPLWKGLVYHMAPEVPLLRGMLTGPEAFLCSPGVSVQRLFAKTHLRKVLCYTSRWNLRQIPRQVGMQNRTEI